MVNGDAACISFSMAALTSFFLARLLLSLAGRSSTAHLRREHEERHAGLRSGCPAADPGHEGREQEQQEQQEQQKQKQKQKQQQEQQGE